MQNVHAERSAGWSALSFAVIVIVATLPSLGFPPLGTSPANLAAYVDTHRAGLLWGAWLTFPAGAFFLWFVAGLRTYLQQGGGRQEGLPDYAFAAGILAVATALVQACLQSAFAYAPPDAFQANGLASLYYALLFMLNGLGFAPIAIFLFAAAHSMRRHASAPGWLAWLGYIAAAGAGLATLTIFFTNPALSPTGAAGAAIGALPALIWVIATGIVMIRTPAGAPRLDTSGSA